MNPYRKAPVSLEGAAEAVDRRASYRATRRRLAMSLVSLFAAALLIPLLAKSCRTKHAPEVPPELLTAAATFPTAPLDLPPAVPLEPLLVADAPDRLAVLEPTEAASSLRPGEPVVVRFNRPMVEGSRVGKAVDDGPLTFSPPVRGRTTWTSRSALSFEADPSTWKGTHTASMGLAPTLRSLAGEEVGDPFVHTVVFDDGPRFAGRSKSARLMPSEPVRLRFSGRVDTATLSAGLMLYEVDGGERMLPFSITTSSRDAKGETSVDLHLKSELEPGAKVAVAIAPPLSHGGARPEVVDFELSPRPHIEGIDCAKEAKEASDCKYTESPREIVDIEEALRLLSTDDLSALSGGAVEVTPSLEALTTEIEDRKKLVIRGNWVPGQVYQVRVKILRDKDGDELMRMPPLAVRSAGRPPAVRVATGHLTFERDAPPTLTIAGIHVEAGEARIGAVPSGGELGALTAPETLVANDNQEAYVGVSLRDLLPGARPNRWARGALEWSELSPSHPSMVVLSVLADKDAASASTLPTTFVQRTDLGIDVKVLSGGVLAWVTSIASAGPVGGAMVTLADHRGLPIAIAPADERGVAWFPVADPTRLSDGVIVRAVSGDDRAVMSVDPRTSMGPRHLGLVPGAAPPNESATVATVFTDRGIVRPGESFHAKALLRSSDAGALALPHASTVRLALFGPSGEAAVSERSVAVSPFGTVDADFTLGPSIEAGTYRVDALVADQSPAVGAATITVGEYRPPTFRVDLAAPVGDLVERDLLRVDVAATHLFGPPAAGMGVRWTMTREERPAPERWEDYAFSPVDVALRDGTMAAGELELDTSGRGTVEAPVDIGAPVRADAVVEVEVSDVSGLSTSARRTIPMYPARFEVGVHETPSWIDAGSTLDLDAIVIEHDGTPVKGRVVDARILREGWHTYWEWAASGKGDEEEEAGAPAHEGSFQARRAHRTEVAHRCKLTSSDAPVHCAWKPERAGTYVLEATTRDERGHVATASQRVYVAGPDEHPDRDRPGASLTLTAQKSDLGVGDMAEIAFESPFADAEALLDVERAGVHVTEVRRVGAGGNVFRFPVTNAMVPNAFVSLSLVKPRTGPPGEKIDLGAPDLRVGLTEVRVRPATSPLAVTIEAPSRALSGTDVPLDVLVKTEAGEGIEAEVALYAVDEGTLRITDYATPDALAGLFPRMAPAFAWEDLRRSLVSRVTEPLLPGAGGDGGGAVAKHLPKEMDRFEPTPLWLPRLVTDTSGHATAVLHLPERPTQYRIMAVAIDAGLRAGKAQETVVATMPVVVRPVLPVVATVGDRFEAVAFIHNTEDTGVDVSVTPDLDGVREAPSTVHIEANGEARVSAWVEVTHEGDLSVRFEASSDRGDVASESRVRVAPRARTVHASAVGAVSSSRTLTLQIPEGDTGPLTLSIAPHPFVGFDTALDALLASPESGVEETASELIGIAAYAELDTGKRPTSVSPAELSARADRAIVRLLALQGPSGAFGDFSASDQADDYLTAFALHALSTADRVGFSVDAAARKRASSWLEARVRGNGFLDGRDSISGTGYDELAFALRVLTEAGDADEERMNALFDQRERLTPYGLAELGMALPPGHLRRLSLVTDASTRILATRQDERSNPSVLRWYDTSARTLGAVLEAASTTEATLDSAPRIASRLLQTRALASGSWWSTHETSHALAALAAYAGTFRSEETLATRVTIDGAPAFADGATGELAWYRWAQGSLRPGAHELRIEANEPAWFAIGASFTVPLGEVDDVARGSDAALHRTFEDAAGKPIASGDHVRLGDLVRVRLFLFSEHDAPPYLVVRDHLAGGLEPLDEGHATSPRESLSALLGMSPDDDVVDARAHYASRSLDLVTARVFAPDHAAFYLAHAGSGLRELTYGVRAMSVGTFVLPPAEVEALYAPGFSARSTLATLTVDP